MLKQVTEIVMQTEAGRLCAPSLSLSPQECPSSVQRGAHALLYPLSLDIARGGT